MAPDAAGRMDEQRMDPEVIRQRVWAELARAALDRHHAWRTPVLATVDKNGLPQARTVVLRHVDTARAHLQFFTDRRSPKFAQLAALPHALLVFWSKRLNWQLRIQARVVLHTAGPEVDAVWERIKQSPAARDYLTPLAPGDVLSTAPARTDDACATHHVAILLAEVEEIDWLELFRGGHRRARMRGAAWDWLTP